MERTHKLSTPIFKDERYIKINGRPVFIIYNIDDIVCLEKMKNAGILY